jgi:hypothetical protein
MRPGQLLAAEQEYAVAAAAGLWPRKRDSRVRALHAPPIVADLDHQQSAGIQVPAGGSDNQAHEIQSVGASRKRHNGFGAIFRRQAPHDRRPDVRWIRNDQIVTFSPQRGEHV